MEARKQDVADLDLKLAKIGREKVSSEFHQKPPKFHQKHK